MLDSTPNSISSGLEVIDLEEYPAFSTRPTRPRSPAAQVVLIGRLAEVLLQNPDSFLQWLVNTALEVCSADSAGISVEQYSLSGREVDAETDAVGYQWVATAGEYASLHDAVFPLTPTACNICLDRGRPQLYRASEHFLTAMGIHASHATDGLMVPWEAEGRRGTIWVLAHGRNEAFDPGHLETMELLSRFAAMGIAQQQRKRRVDQEWAITAASAVIKVLALRIDGPLQELSDLVFLAQSGAWEGTAASLAERLQRPLSALTDLVEQSLGQNAHSRPN